MGFQSSCLLAAAERAVSFHVLMAIVVFQSSPDIAQFKFLSYGARDTFCSLSWWESSSRLLRDVEPSLVFLQVH